MTEITIPVPAERIPEFYQFFGLWLAGSLSLPGSGPVAVGTPPDASGFAPVKEWGNTDSDLEDAVLLWNKFSTNARAMFSLLIDNAGKKFTGEQIAEAANIPNGAHGVAGVLAWPGRHGYAIGRGRVQVSVHEEPPGSALESER